ncbi:hypothetical protein [Sphingobacterium faecium]|uniref:hypothetical protein n=1 Tax=Sphingobacterium faecium TaxID=34087 RepID=UPI002468B726|nr:hypothetical protein [Sphingobacterium faecium]MDH5825863.1 hypothetical protein [Sphingobacterium faecium]
MGVIEIIKKQEREAGMSAGMSAGLAAGIEKGRLEERAKLKAEKQKAELEKAMAIALEFKKMGLPIADIAKATGLSIAEIEKL